MKPKTSSSSLQPKLHTSNETTIAEFNRISSKISRPNFNENIPLRIRLPEYFNIPSFEDKSLFTAQNVGKVCNTKQDVVFKKRMKDLSLLAQGMKRAKNIKQESRYYFTQGVILHNAEQYLKSIEYFEKFLKIVIFLEDHKSIELALNVLGCSYMYLQHFEKSIQFHQKQSQMKQRADTFIGYLNIGMCYELKGDYKKAQENYQKAASIQQEDTERQADDLRERKELLELLVQRVEGKNRIEQVFMTENTGQQKVRKKSPQKSIQASLIKQQSSLLMKKMGSRKQYQSAKINYAISMAEQNIQQHLHSSIKYDNL